MPRIPSAAEVNPIGGSASRLPSVRADAADFSLAIAQGLASFGEGVSDVGDRISKDARRAAAEEERERKNEQLLQLYEASKKSEAAKQVADEGQHRAEVREAAIAMVDNWEYDGSSPLEAAAKASRDLESVEEERLKQLPAEQRASLKAATQPIRRGQALRVAQRAQNQSVAMLNRQTEKTLQLLQRQAVQEPAAAAHYATEGRAQLLSLQSAGALTPEQFAAQEETFRRNLYTAVVRGQPAVQALADLEDGVYDEALSDPELKQFLTQETAWRLQSETAQGAAAAEAQLARVRRGEGTPGELSATSGAVLAAGDMADVELQAEVALRVRSELQSLRYAPEAEVEGRIDALAPALDAADTAARQQVQQEVWTQSRMMLRERDKDPAAYVMEQPAVAEAFAAAEKNPARLPDAIAARLAAQSAMGLVPEAQNALTLEERARIVDGLRRLEPQQQIAAMLELGRLYGDQAAKVASDLAETGLSMEMQLAADASGGPEVSGRLAQAGESNGGAQAAEGGVIEETAERLIAEGRGAAGATADHGQERSHGVGSSTPPTLPRRKPESLTMPAHIEEGVKSETSDLTRSKPLSADDAVLRQHQSLRAEDYSEMLDGLDPAEVAAFEAHVRRAASGANAPPEIEDLARRFVVKKLRTGMPFADAVAEALYEAGIDAAKEVAMGEADSREDAPPLPQQREEEDVDRLLRVIGINPVLREGDAETVLPLVKEIMQVRTYAAAGEYQRIKDLRKKIEKLDGTEHRFLYKPLTAKLDRALQRPETVPWALSDGEVYSVYKSLGGSVDALTIGGMTLAVLEKFLAPAYLLSWATSLAGFQQNQMRKLYEAELYRRGIFRKPNVQP